MHDYTFLFTGEPIYTVIKLVLVMKAFMDL